MGWKGTMRAIRAAQRRAEKSAEREQKQRQKQQITDNTANDVESWKSYTKDLVSVHTDIENEINWHRLIETPKPTQPIKKTTHINKANALLTAFKPRFSDLFSGGSNKRRLFLEDDLYEAPRKDELEFLQAKKIYKSECEEWKRMTKLARRLVIGDADAIKEIIAEMQELFNEPLIGSEVNFNILDNYIHATPHIHTDEIVPSTRKKQLASGGLSETKMPTGMFNELYQDYVASVALKTAGNLFRILPLEEVYVTCKVMMLNSSTGHQELTPILSVMFVRETFRRLNLKQIDPSDSLANFNHVVAFSKIKGFSPIIPLETLG